MRRYGNRYTADPAHGRGSHQLMVRLSDEQLATLDRYRGDTPRSTHLRQWGLNPAPSDDAAAAMEATLEPPKRKRRRKLTGSPWNPDPYKKRF